MPEKNPLEQIGSQMPEGTERKILPDGKEEFDLSKINSEGSLNQLARGEIASEPRKVREAELHTIEKRSPNIHKTPKKLAKIDNAIFESHIRNFDKYGLKKKENRGARVEARELRRKAGEQTLDEQSQALFHAKQKRKPAKRQEEVSDASI